MAEVASVSVSSQLSGIESSLSILSENTRQLGERMNDVDRKMNNTLAQLEALKKDFLRMMDEQRKEAEFQRATTELVRVRQELEQKFGNYKVVRDTMLGVLQATDAKLVRQTTISKVSEELMLSTPKYWLAPCLIAVAAWIGNDRALADRAISEAMRRDTKRTALCMALVCRRNGREDTCFEWLSLYFSKLDARNFSDLEFSFVDAYVNGVFGEDRKHRCDDYIANWINEIRDTTEDFEKKQVEQWDEMLRLYVQPMDGHYPALKKNVKEFGRIDDYLGRICASGSVETAFDNLAKAPVDQTQLVRGIDERLVQLVSDYAQEEKPLRDQEEELTAIKAYRGDVFTAQKVVEGARRLKKAQKMDMVAKMTDVISGGKGRAISERKTAISFLKNYINDGYDRFLDEKSEAFPTQISIGIDGWTGNTVDGSNETQLLDDYEKYMDGLRQQKVDAVNMKPGLPWFIGAGVLGVFGLFMIPHGVILVLLMLLGAGAAGGYGYLQNKKAVQTVESINNEYKELIAKGKGEILITEKEWLDVRSKVSEFRSKERKKLVA